MSRPKMFDPIKIGSMEVKNRVAMAAMATNLEDGDGFFSKTQIAHYVARAKGGVGLIAVGGVSIDKVARYWMKTPGAWHDKYIPTWSALADALHEHGTKLIPQLIHPGSVDPAHPSAPSFVPLPTKDPTVVLTPHVLTTEEVEGIVEDFGEGARRMREAGCDGVQVHFAHGAYALTSAFVSPLLNKRTDAYGGSMEGRLKFPLDIVKSIRAKAGYDFPLIIRLSGEDLIRGGRTLEETMYIAYTMVKAGVDAIEISAGAIPEIPQRVVPTMGTPLAWNAPYTAALKQVVDVPIMIVGNNKTPQMCEYLFQTGRADMVTLGRALLADPEWVNKAAAGLYDDIIPCIGCNTCSHNTAHLQPVVCALNANTGRDPKEMAITPAEKRKKVLIVGGGPSGMEAARVAALRGHDVTLVEKAESMGGQLNIGCIPPMKQPITMITKYYARQLKNLNVKVEFGTEATVELVKDRKPDAVVVATGGSPVIPTSISGTDKKCVVTAWDVLAGKAALGKNIVVIGGGSVGCETADFLTHTNYLPFTLGTLNLTIVEMLETIGMDFDDGPRREMVKALYAQGVKVVTLATVKSILDDGLVYVKDGREETIRGIDNVVLSIGTRPLDTLSAKIKGNVPEVYLTGDAVKPGKIIDAILSGTEIGRKM